MIEMRLPADTPVNSELIAYCLRTYEPEQKRFRHLHRYLVADNVIKQRVMSDPELPNNKLSHNFARYISNIATAYFMGRGCKYEVDDPAFKQRLDELLEDNFADTRSFEEAKEMSVMGIAYELLYIDPDGDLKTHRFRANTVIPVYSDSIGQFLLMALVGYVKQRIDGTKTFYVDVYTKTEVITFQNGNQGGAWTEISRRVHLIGDVPVLIRRNNEDCKADFEDIIPLIDAYDRAQSDTLNDLDYFTDAYLAVFGVEEIEEEKEDLDEAGKVVVRQQAAKGMKQRRTLFFPQGGDAKFLIKAIDDAATEHFKERIYKDIFFLSQVPNLTDESFSGNLSGVAIKYKLFGLEELAQEKEKYWKSAERKKLKLLTEHINTRYGTNYDWRDVKISFDRSQIANLTEIAQNMNNLRELLSQQTIIEMWPDVENAAEELKQLAAEKEATENTGGGDGEVY